MPAGMVQAEKHQLTLERNRPIGSKYQVRIQGNQTQKQTQTFNGQQVGGETRKLTGAMTAVAEVLAQHKNKQVRSVALKVEKFEGQINDKQLKLDTAKRVVASVKDGKKTFAYEDGTPIGAETGEVLDMLVMFMLDDDPDDVSDDRMFKLDQPREVGTKWECDNKLLAKDLASGGELVVTEDNIKSEFQFLDVAEFAGQKAAVFDIKVDLQKFSFPGAKEQGLDVKKSEGVMKMSGLLPLDTKSGDGAIQMQMAIGITAELKIEQGTVRLDFEINGEADAEFREVK